MTKAQAWRYAKNAGATAVDIIFIVHTHGWLRYVSVFTLGCLFMLWLVEVTFEMPAKRLRTDIDRSLNWMERRYLDQVYALEDLLAVLDLHVNTYYVTSRITTQQADLYADSVERSCRRAWEPNADIDPVGPRTVDRWWK